MALQRRFSVDHPVVFPKGAWAKGDEVEPVRDFNATVSATGEVPQEKDKETLLPVWQVLVMDPDESADKKNSVMAVKIVSAEKPVMPDNPTPFPLTEVVFVGLTATPYAEYTGRKNREGNDGVRIAWSYRAAGITAPGKAASGPRAVAS